MNDRSDLLVAGVVIGLAIGLHIAAKKGPLFTVRVVHELELGANDTKQSKPFWLRAILSRFGARSFAGERAGSRLTPGSESTHAGARPQSLNGAHDAPAA
jgi:hypothetical protein